MLLSQPLPDFQQYLLSRKLVPVKNVNFYAYWASRYFTFSTQLMNADPAAALRLENPLVLLLEGSPKSAESGDT